MSKGGSTHMQNLDCYGADWLADYERTTGFDAQLKLAEHRVFDQLVSRWLSVVGAESSALRHLDIGTCGGRYVEWSLDHGIGAVVGIDKCDAAVRHCRKRFGSRAVFHRADILQDDIAHGRAPFNLVTAMFGTINHFSTSELDLFFERVLRLIGPRSAVVLSGWRDRSCRFSLYTPREPAFLKERILSLDDIQQSAETRGLRVADWQTSLGHLVTVLTYPDARQN